MDYDMPKMLHELSQQELCDRLRKRMESHQSGNAFFYGDVLVEKRGELTLIYFESRSDVMHKRMKRYHKMACSNLGFSSETYYHEGNVIDIDKGYGIREVIVSYKQYVLARLDEIIVC